MVLSAETLLLACIDAVAMLVETRSDRIQRIVSALVVLELSAATSRDLARSLEGATHTTCRRASRFQTSCLKCCLSLEQEKGIRADGEVFVARLLLPW